MLCEAVSTHGCISEWIAFSYQEFEVVDQVSRLLSFILAI